MTALPKIFNWKDELKVPTPVEDQTIQAYASELNQGVGEMAEALLETYLEAHLGRQANLQDVAEFGGCNLDGFGTWTYTWKGKPVVSVRIAKKRTLYLLEGKFLCNP